MGTFVGGIVLAIITALCIVALLVKHQRRVRDEAAAERRRDDLLRAVDAVNARLENQARLDQASQVYPPHTEPRPSSTDPHIFEVRPSPPLSADEVRQTQVEARARQERWATEEILEREG